MRVLLISTVCAEGAYLHKALRESAHSLQMTDDLRDGLHLALQETFDTVLIVAVDSDAIGNLTMLLSGFARLPGSPAILVVLGRATPVERARMLRAGADACFVQPYSFIEMQERMLALHRSSAQGLSDYTLDLPLKLDPLTRELVEGGKRFPLTKREFLLGESLLECFCGEFRLQDKLVEERRRERHPHAGTDHYTHHTGIGAAGRNRDAQTDRCQRTQTLADRSAT